jgi:hypothetical protein
MIHFFDGEDDEVTLPDAAPVDEVMEDEDEEIEDEPEDDEESD